MSKIDPDQLPEYALIDTGVLIRALGDHPSDPRSQSCRDFFDAMVANRRQMAVAAPSLAEMLRGNPSAPPHVAGVRVLPFDYVSAVACGRQFPREVVEQEADKSGESKGYTKFDLQIVACAMAHRVPYLVSLDPHQCRRAEECHLKTAQPSDFYAKQLDWVAERAAEE